MKASTILLFKENSIIASGGGVGLAECVISREGSFGFREFSTWVVTLTCVQNVPVFVQSLGGSLVLVFLGSSKERSRICLIHLIDDVQETSPAF